MVNVMKNIPRLLLSALVAAVLLAALPAAAGVTGVATIPSSANTMMGPGTALTINWRIARTASAKPYTVISPVGKFQPDVLANIPWATTGSISRSFTVSQPSIIFTETVLVPQAVMQKALASNGGNFIYLRSFSDDNFTTQMTGDVDLHVAGGGIGGPLTVTEERLNFDDGSTTATRAPGSRLTAQAILNVSGMGLLRAVWEVNDSGTDGDAFFRPVRDVTQSVAGQRNVILTSPALPTDDLGRRTVRLRITDPASGFEPPTITYFVAGEPGEADIHHMPVIEVTAPADGAVVHEGSAFSWKPVKGAAGYKLQIMAGGDTGGIVAKMMMKGDRTSAALSPLTFSRLETPASYNWRVLAFDRSGTTIATSRVHPVKVRSGSN